MKQKNNPAFPHFLLLFLGFATALLFYLVLSQTKTLETMLLVKKKIFPQENKEFSQSFTPLPAVVTPVVPSLPTTASAPTKNTPSLALKIPRFNLQHVRSGTQQVPRVYLSRLPKSIKSQKGPQKQAFIKALLPILLAENERVLQERRRLITLFDQIDAGYKLTSQDRQWLYQTACAYRVKSINRRAVLACVDVVPPSLALAQAILETGFGSSHAALNKNSVFGHMATLTKVASFPTLIASVKAYVQNLNRHAAYKNFRSLRAQARENGKNLSGYTLAQGLGQYSIRGKSYVHDVRLIIQNLKLDSFDNAALQKNPKIVDAS